MYHQNNDKKRLLIFSFSSTLSYITYKQIIHNFEIHASTHLSHITTHLPIKEEKTTHLFFFSHIITYIQNTHYFGIYSSPHPTNLHTFQLKKKRLFNDYKRQLKSLSHIKYSIQNLTTHFFSIYRNNFFLTLTLTFTLSLT